MTLAPSVLQTFPHGSYTLGGALPVVHHGLKPRHARDATLCSAASTARERVWARLARRGSMGSASSSRHLRAFSLLRHQPCAGVVSVGVLVQKWQFCVLYFAKATAPRPVAASGHGGRRGRVFERLPPRLHALMATREHLSSSVNATD